MAVSYTELDGSPVENLSTDEFTATMELKCDWDDRRDVMAYFARVYNPYSNPVQSPISYPHLLSANAGVTSIGCQPFGGAIINDGGLASYDFAQITVGFSNAYDSSSEEIVSETIEPTAEFMTVDPTALQWTSGDDLKPEEAPGILLQGLNYTVDYPRRRNIPSGYLAAVGHCNSAAVTSLTLGLTFPAQTLLYTPAGCTKTYMTDGSGAYSIAMSFQYKPGGWNTFWRQKTSSWEQMQFKDGGAIYLNYPTYDFSGLR